MPRIIWFVQEVSQGGCETVKLKNPGGIRYACAEQVYAPAPANSYRRILYAIPVVIGQIKWLLRERDRKGKEGGYQNKALPRADILV